MAARPKPTNQTPVTGLGLEAIQVKPRRQQHQQAQAERGYEKVADAALGGLASGERRADRERQDEAGVQLAEHDRLERPWPVPRRDLRREQQQQTQPAEHDRLDDQQWCQRVPLASSWRP